MEGTVETCRIPSCCKPVYYGTLGVEKALSAADEEAFYRKYHKEILLEESYKTLWKLFCGR